MTTNELMIELSHLWDGEWDTVKITAETPYIVNQWNPPLTWYVDLVSMTEYDSPHLADFTERTWRFYSELLGDALADALQFARDLKALAPPEEG
jgi:hypothetical protein